MSGCNCKWGGCVVHKVTKVLVIIGGLNWGLVGLSMLLGKGMSWNLVNMILGSWPMVEAVVYLLVGVSAVAEIFGCKCKKCMAACASCTACQTGGMGENKM